MTNSRAGGNLMIGRTISKEYSTGLEQDSCLRRNKKRPMPRKKGMGLQKPTNQIIKSSMRTSRI
jgi:hypothetical protein